MAYLVFGRQAGKRQMEKNHEESGVTDGCFQPQEDGSLCSCVVIALQPTFFILKTIIVKLLIYKFAL